RRDAQGLLRRQHAGRVRDARRARKNAHLQARRRTARYLALACRAAQRLGYLGQTMKLVVYILVTLFVATALTLAAIENPGYVLIARAPWSIEMPLTLFIPLLIVAFFLAYGVF